MLGELLRGYRWLWRAQSRWRPSPLWLAAPSFLVRVVADITRLAIPNYIWRTDMSLDRRRPTAAALLVWGAATSLVVGGAIATATWVADLRTDDAPEIKLERVFVNHARMRVGDGPVSWRFSGPGLTPVYAAQIQAAFDSMVIIENTGFVRLVEHWDEDPTRWVSTFAPEPATPGLESMIRVGVSPPALQPESFPTVLNPTEVEEAIVRSYPRELLAERLGGTVAVQFLVNAEGAVERVRISQISGYPELDEAALEVASVYRFSPAVHDGEQVSSWAISPISFRTRAES